MNTLYPIFLNIAGQEVLVVGGGSVASQKIRGLLDANARVTVIAPAVGERVRAQAEAGEIVLRERRYARGDAAKYSLVIAATDDPVVQREVYEDASARRIPVNVADVPALCSFFLSSTFREGDLAVAVSTNGKSPTLGKYIRDAIRAEFAGGYPELLETLGTMRPHVLKEFPDYEGRKDLFERVVRTEVKRLQERDPKHAGVFTNAVRGLPGRVILVGAGPGDPGLITVKGAQALGSADVVLYDALISHELLRLVPEGAERMCVGKEAGKCGTRQEEINDLLVSKAREGKTVVRLKGGDPFIFGRGGEELEVLREEGIPFEIIPGITAGTGIPSSMGLPLTDRRYASSVVFLTGHEDPSKKGAAVDWEVLSRVESAVVYMGLNRLPDIVGKMRLHGVPASRPVAVIVRGTLPDEEVIVGTLMTIEYQTAALRARSPALIVVGEAVNLLHRRNLRHESILKERQTHEEPTA